jgi:CheY-like chemotaxis protein
MGDSGQLQQIIMNLIINAVEAIGDKKGTIRVVLKKTFIDSGSSETDTFGTAIQPGRYTCLEVTDTGSGMDEEIQKRIFEPFYTTKFTGRGLGMSAIRGIVSSHEGILQLTSTPGVGTTFKVCFPVPEVSDHAESDASASHSVEKASGNILLVEDEQTLRDMGKALLEAMGFSTLTAHHGGEAVEIYRKRSSEIDVILLDLIMPEMGGVEAYQELRKISSTLPIIICSGFGVESASDVIEHDPHAGFVHKPYKPGELRNELVRMMVGHTQ